MTTTTYPGIVSLNAPRLASYAHLGTPLTASGAPSTLSVGDALRDDMVPHPPPLLKHHRPAPAPRYRSHLGCAEMLSVAFVVGMCLLIALWIAALGGGGR